MRRFDREVTEWNDIISIMQKCEVCRLALNGDGCPYILPLNFGMAVKGNQIELYFHGALEGAKYELMQKDPRASFEMDCSLRLAPEPEQGNCTMEYESVIGRGTIQLLPEGEKEEALHILMKHYRQEDFPYNKAMLPRTRVFKLVVESVTAKRRMPKV